MSSPSSKQTAKQLNAYAIFLILERQRNLKLRELYRNKQVVDALLPVISEEESSASTTATTTSAATRTSSLRQAMKMKKKCEATSSSCMSTLPKLFPPRYQALASIITSDVLMMQLRTTTPTSPRGSRQQRSPSSSHPTPSSSSSYLEEYKNLDQSTKRFLNDTVKIIQDRYNEEVENNETKLEIIDVRRRSSSRRTKAKVVGSKKLFVFRVEKKLSLIVD